MTTYETIREEKFDNNTCNIVSTMKRNKEIWSGYGESNIFFQTAVNKKSLGGNINNDRKIHQTGWNKVL